MQKFVQAGYTSGAFCGRSGRGIKRRLVPALAVKAGGPTPCAAGLENIGVVAGAGIEPATQGFSVLCSTN